MSGKRYQCKMCIEPKPVSKPDTVCEDCADDLEKEYQAWVKETIADYRAASNPMW